MSLKKYCQCDQMAMVENLFCYLSNRNGFESLRERRPIFGTKNSQQAWKNLCC